MKDQAEVKEADAPFWESINDEDQVIEFSNAIDGFLVPPEEGNIMEGPNAVVYAAEAPSKLFKGRRCFPSRIEADTNLTKEKMGDNLACKIVQVSNIKQYVVIEDDLAFCVTGMNVKAFSDKIFEIRLKIAFNEVEDKDELETIKSLI